VPAPSIDPPSRAASVCRRLASYQGAAPVCIGLLFSLALLCAAFPHLHRRQSYPDLVAGYLAYHGGDKAQDTRAFLLLVGLTIALPLLVAAVARFVAPQGHRSATGRAVHQLLLFSLVPAAWRLAVDAARPVDQVPRFAMASMFPQAALLGLLLLARYRRGLRPADVLTTGGAVVLVVFLSIFVGFALGVFCVRVIPVTHPWLDGRGGTLAHVCTGISVAVLVALMARSPTVGLFQDCVLRWLRALQYPLVLLFFHLVPPPFVDPQHRFNEAYPTALVAAVAVGVAGSWWCMWHRARAAPPADLGPAHRHPLARALAPAAVAALLVYVYCAAPSWPALDPDDFHWGEQALPWQQLVTFHKVPYVDFVPIHGLMAYLRGAFSSLFFDGTAASYADADFLLTGVATIALALAACLSVTPLGALVLLGGLLPDHDRIYFYIPAMLLLSAPQLVRDPIRLLTVWLVVAFLLFAYNPTQGPAFAVATLPVALWAAWRSLRTRRAALGRIAVSLVALASVVLAVPVARHVCRAFVAFVAENAYTNEVAHGIPWTDGKGLRVAGWGPAVTAFLWEVTRSFWFFAAVACAAVFWRQATGGRSRGPGHPAGPRSVSLLILTGSLPLYLLFWSPWLNGRLLPGNMNYPGDVSLTCLYWLVPILVLLTVSHRRMATALLALAVVTGLFYPANPTLVDPVQLNAKCVAARVVPADVVAIDGATIGMPRIGKVVRPNALVYLQPIKAFLARFLRPGETYLDLTNRTALYYYLNLPCPVRYVPFVAANSRLQAGVLRQLDEHPVPAVLIAPAIMIDMVSPGFRSYFVFRRYATTYSLVTGPGYAFAFLVDPARGAALVPPASPVGSAAHTAGVDDYCYYMDDLKRLPASFGSSWSTLAPMFAHVVDVDPAAHTFSHDVTVAGHDRFVPAGPNPYVEFAVPPEAACGRRADFLRLRFAYNPSSDDPDGPPDHDPQLAVRWVSRGVGRYSRPFTLDAPTGDLLIPLGAYPRWLLANDLMTIRFDLLHPERARSFRLARIEFLHLTDPTAQPSEGHD
jgi:hypothetical protein